MSVQLLDAEDRQRVWDSIEATASGKNLAGAHRFPHYSVYSVYSVLYSVH